MTIERTRELLGDKVAMISDDDLLLLIARVDTSALEILKVSVKALANKKKGIV